MYTILVLPHPQQWVGYCPVSAAGLRGEHLVRVGQCCRWCLEAGPTHGMGRSISLLSNCSWFENEQACLQPFTEKGILQVCFFFFLCFPDTAPKGWRRLISSDGRLWDRPGQGKWPGVSALLRQTPQLGPGLAPCNVCTPDLATLADPASLLPPLQNCAEEASVSSLALSYPQDKQQEGALKVPPVPQAPARQLRCVSPLTHKACPAP